MADTQTSSARLNDDESYTSESYLYTFWDRADGYVPNKFHIGLSGEYVEKALQVMYINSMRDKYSNKQKTFKGSTPLRHRFEEWLNLYWNTKTRMLSMFWNCQSVTLPNPSLSISESKGLDKLKDMGYPIAKSVNGNNTISLHILDNQYLMWMHFFNSLFNSQIDPLILRPSSTFHKIKLNIEVLGGQMAINANGTVNTTDLDIYQMYEYNSIVLTASPVVNPSNSSQELYNFEVKFECPNPLNGTFKTDNRNLADNTTTKSATQVKSGVLDYNIDFWEWKKSSDRKSSATAYDALSSSDEAAFKKNKNLFTMS